MSLPPAPERPAPPEPVPAGPPGPPPGPGVQPPFVAPPTDGARQRRTLALVLAGIAVLVVCSGGLLGMGGLVVFGTQMIVDQSRSAVTDHLNAVQSGDFKAAYDGLCDSTRSRITESAYRRSLEDQPRITSFTVRDPVITDEIVVPATVRYADGTSRSIRFLLEQDTATGDFEVCGEKE